MNIKGLFRRSVDIIPFSLRDRIRRVPLLKKLQRFFYARLLADQTFDYRINAGPARGLVYPVHMPQDKLIWAGTYELEFAQRVNEAVKRRGVCYDVGGYRGYFTGLMAVSGASRVFVFEPFSENVAQIKRMISLNPHLDITVVQKAVSNDLAPALFLLMPELSMCKLKSSPFENGTDHCGRVLVSQETLDHFVFELGNPEPDLVKIDVEGAEHMVIEGALRLMRASKPQLLIEIHSQSIGEKCFHILTDLGYHVSVLETNRVPDFASDPCVCHYVCL